MKQLIARGIVLARTDYGEADRILTLLTPEQGKLRLMARGVRKIKSKLAGGIELFSTSDISYLNGRGEIGTLVSARLDTYYSHIVQDIDRVQLGYELIKMIHRATEDEPEAEYFALLEQSFQALNEQSTDLQLIHAWFQAQLLRIAGHSPNLQSDTFGQLLTADQSYAFDYENMTFAPSPHGKFAAPALKGLRLLFSPTHIATLAQVQGLQPLIPQLTLVVKTSFQSYIRS